MKDKIIIKKFKNNYNGYAALGVWFFMLFIFAYGLRAKLVRIIEANLISQLDLLLFLLLMTALFPIILKYKLKHEPDNYTRIEIEGEIKCQKYRNTY